MGRQVVDTIPVRFYKEDEELLEWLRKEKARTGVALNKMLKSMIEEKRKAVTPVWWTPLMDNLKIDPEALDKDKLAERLYEDEVTLELKTTGVHESKLTITCGDPTV